VASAAVDAPPPPPPAPSAPVRRGARRRGALLGAIGLLAVAGSAVPFLLPRDRPRPTPARVVPLRVPTAAATTDIPPAYLRLYRRFGREMDVDWRFLAAIGGQESDHGRNPAARRVNAAGCVGPMQIGVGGRCGDFVGAWGVDGDGDGRVDPRAPADAIATAARGLRLGKGAPAPGGSWRAYYHAACAYYGACRDARADYAADVMRRAARYGLRPPGGSRP
jgi:membrane-bound lytic murein transglycosylase B